MATPVDPVIALLDAFEPGSAEEAADVARVRALLAGGGDAWSRATPLHVTGSALIVHPPTRRVLLRWHTRQRAWIQVGGHGDPGERDPLTVAVREGHEETGLADLVPWPDGRLVHLVIVDVPAARHEAAHQHADLRFVLATRSPDDVRPEDPEAPLRWLDVPDASALTEANVRVTISRIAWD
jgi:8-oxo-dGTP pyrophosphatase MutT (NUDIX family)